MPACPAPKDGRAEAHEAHALRGQMPCLCRCLGQLRVSQVVLVVKNLPANAGDLRDTSLISGLGRSLGGGHGNPLQYPCLENPVDRGGWRSTVMGSQKSRTQLKRLSMLSSDVAQGHLLLCCGCTRFNARLWHGGRVARVCVRLAVRALWL